ncbi:S-methyl-5'-thioadenosine phosphorylase [Halobacteriovorax sp.]|uniref:S-methyl-5'-thioadenosine phosphorylase n=1 Tax=Halobacteriovorax sp. TaxID=2020862 RepID=UPI003AF312F9
MSLAIIGGSGIYDIEGIEQIEKVDVKTPFGSISAPIIKFKLGNVEFYFLTRHGQGHRLNPSEVNYRANIYALKKLGVKKIISVSAVGSLREEIRPGDIVLPDQFIDWTKGIRKRTFFENGVVGHVSVAEPVELILLNQIYEAASAKVKVHKGGNYICIEGPQFSTKAESHLYRKFGADIIGMTNVPEAYLAKEAAIAYATIALVTDYDCWSENTCSVEEIMSVLKENVKNAQAIVKNIITNLKDTKYVAQTANKHIVVTKDWTMNVKNEEAIKTILD